MQELNRIEHKHDEALILHILSIIGDNNFVIEFLDSSEQEFANVRNLLNNGYQGVIFQQDQKNPKKDWIYLVCQSMLTEVKKSNITNPSIYPTTGRTLKVPHDFDALSVDLNGNDYWLLDEILKYFKPKLIVCEFNPFIEGSVSIKLNPDFRWSGDNYYGFSFEAGKKLAEKYGYYVIFQNDNINLYMVAQEYVNMEGVPDVKYEKKISLPHNSYGEWVNV